MTYLRDYRKRFRSFSVCNVFMLSCFVLLALGSVLTSAQYISLGKCPRAFGMPQFDIHRYAGRWYEIEKYWFALEAAATCVSVEYFDKYDGTFAVEIDQFENIAGKMEKNPGITKFASRDGSGSFVLDLLITQSPVPFVGRFPYLVLETDYETYTIKYRCVQAGAFNAQMLWILSRNKTMEFKTREKVYDTLRRIGIDTTRLTISDQSSCPEYSLLV